MLKNIIENKYSVYILASIIPFLAISIFISDLIFSFYSLLFLFYAIKNKFSFIHKNKFYLLFLCFYFTIILSSLFSDNILHSLKSSIFFIRVFFFIGLISYLIEQKPIIKEIFYKFLFITFFVVIFFGLIQFFILHSSQELSSVPNLRLKLFMTDKLKLGSYLSRLYGLLLALYIFRNSKSKYENWLFFLLTVLVVITVFLSGERTSFFFIVLFLFLAFFLLDNFSLKAKFFFVFSVLIFISIFSIYFDRVKTRMFYDDNNKIQISKNKDKIIIFTPEHTGHYVIAYKMFIDKPFLGHGPGMFRFVCAYDKYNDNKDKAGCSTHPHNNYLQLLAETGIFGFLFLIIFLVYVLYFIFKKLVNNIFSKKKYLNNYRVTLILAIFVNLWPFSPSGNFFNNWLLIAYTLPLAFYIGEFFSKKN